MDAPSSVIAFHDPVSTVEPLEVRICFCLSLCNVYVYQSL